MNPADYLRHFFQKNGMALGLFLLIAVAFWMFILIILPQLFMVDFSLSKNLPPADLGGPSGRHDPRTLQVHDLRQLPRKPAATTPSI